MLVDITSVHPKDNYKLEIEFEDGITGTVDLKQLIQFKGIFEYLNDKKQFDQVQVNEETGTIFWPNGADLDPDVLYSIITGKSIPEFASFDLAD